MYKERLKKYQPYPQIDLPDRQWPSAVISKAPRWCSVDLRDGNQSLIQPMNLEEKLELFQLLMEIGCKEIEVGFPSASQVEYDFTRLLIKEKRIPDDVLIQALTQAREPLIKKTFAAFTGAKEAIIHLYNSTSVLQREVVFKKGRKDIIALGVQGAKIIKKLAADTDTRIRYEYSPESFTGTELPYALEICEAIMDVWEPTPDNPVIINLPATVEMATPNIYADQIEWFCRNMKSRDCACISLHTHNDRGTGVAATELGLMAGADRVEGTLFGNGERTGNVDILTLALNMFTQGIDPNLDFSNLNKIVHVYQRCTKMNIHPRHPYAGELVYTAFSGSHQDAINKGMEALRENKSERWAVPYLPIDPQDVGRTYESIIRINSQSGKGGAAYIMDQEFGFKLPKEMHPEFGSIIQLATDAHGDELSRDMVFHCFEKEYLVQDAGLKLKKFTVLERHVARESDEQSCGQIEAVLGVKNGDDLVIAGKGNGALDAFCAALRKNNAHTFTINAYHEHALNSGSSSKAVSYIEIVDAQEQHWWGVGIDSDIILSSIKGLLGALNRAEREQNT